jgi:hypothetical protein
MREQWEDLGQPLNEGTMGTKEGIEEGTTGVKAEIYGNKTLLLINFIVITYK